ncbi:MAG: tyrosine--tRNA ligase [Elusimicrobiales bacterium]|nr:tyrosine--tRNA ligase [Elusimicrobiales bacterium]
MDFLQAIERGTVDIISKIELTEKLKKKKTLKIKLGVDPTSPDLHLGHSVVLNKLRIFQDFGHTAVLIIGDFTAQIGDPSGRDSTRPILSYSEILKNAETYTQQAFKILDKTKTEVLFNSKWLKNFLSFNDFQFDCNFIKVSRNITVSRLLEREDFKNRMKNQNPITLLEMLYPIFQGYDSVAVNADVELGGQDQIFNLLVGRDMQKMYGIEPQVCITVPLLIGTDGVKKMSKSYGNYIALNDEPFDMFGKIMSINDELMYKYYEILTLEDMSTIKFMHPMDAKKKLAHIIVERFHGKNLADESKKRFESIFSKKEIPQDISVERVIMPVRLSKLLVKIGAVNSNNEARRLILSGAVKINSQKIIQDIDINKDEFIIQCGKRFIKKISRG